MRSATLIVFVLLGFGVFAAEDDPEAQIDKIRKKVLTQGKVCADPARPCPDFKPNELSFAITGKKFDFDRGEDRSQPFYAVILRSDKLCSIQEAERLEVQAQFSSRKVFVHQHFCQDFGDKVTYTNVNRKVGFIAVYAGETEEEGRAFLAQVRAAAFKDATLRRMQSVVIYQIE